MNKRILSLAGAAAVVASAAALIGYKSRRDLKQSILSYKSATGELVTAFVATTAGTVLAIVADQLNEEKYPNRAEKLQKADDKLTSLCTSKSTRNKEIS